MSLPADVGSRGHEPREPENFSTLSFAVVGDPDDGGAGHFIALAAFQRLVRTHHDGAPDRLRPFSVSFFGLGTDFLSRQLASIGSAILQDRLSLKPATAVEAPAGTSDLDVAAFNVSDFNVVLCTSLRKLPDTSSYQHLSNGCVFLATGDNVNFALMRHGVNGYCVRTDDVWDLARRIKLLLNRESTPDRALRHMSQVSRTLAEQFRRNLAGQARDPLR